MDRIAKSLEGVDIYRAPPGQNLPLDIIWLYLCESIPFAKYKCLGCGRVIYSSGRE